jgi:hypothetical protein
VSKDSRRVLMGVNLRESVCCFVHLAVVGCYGYRVRVRKRDREHGREDDFLFHHLDGSAPCSRNQVGCMFPWQPQIWNRAEKNYSISSQNLRPSPRLYFRSCLHHCSVQKWNVVHFVGAVHFYKLVELFLLLFSLENTKV